MILLWVFVLDGRHLMKKFAQIPMLVAAVISLCLGSPVFASPSTEPETLSEEILHAEGPISVCTSPDTSDITPYITVTGNGGIAVLDYTGGGELYWAIDPAFSSSYSYSLIITLTNNRTGSVIRYPISGFGSGRTDGIVDLNVSDGNTYTVTMSGHADDVLLGLYYYFGDGLTVRFAVRF